MPSAEQTIRLRPLLEQGIDLEKLSYQFADWNVDRLKTG